MPGIEDLQNKKAGQSLTNFLNADPKQIAFGIEAQINNLMGEYEMAIRNGEMARASEINDQINELDKMKIELVNKSVPVQAQNLRQMYNEISLGAAPGGDMGSEITRSLVERDPEKVRFFQKEMGDLDQMFGGVGVKGYAGGAEVVGIVYDDGVVQISEQEVQDAIKEYKRMNRELVAAMNIPDSEIRQEVLPKLRNSKEVRLMEGGRYSPSENPNRPEMIKGYAGGGEASFPDLTGDNKVTQADILKGRGVFAEGDEVSMMMMEMEGDEDGMQEAAMKELEAARPEFEMMQQLAQVVINLIEQGASEAEIVALLKEQGLDEEDIQTLLEFVNEMMGQAEQVGMAEEDIGSQLAALG